MFKRLLKLPLQGESSIFLFGARGTGKTSWIKEKLKDSIYLDLLDFATYSSLLANPSRLENLIPRDYQDWIVIDEVQRVPELLNEVHRLIEHKKFKFLLTGSSARTLRRSGVNLLAGRALRYYMHPLVIQEIGSSFSLDHALQFGLLPAAVEHKDPKKYLESYVQTYVREEVLQEGLTRNIGSFTRFLETASFSQAQVLNISEVARELSLNRLTVSSYFDILEDLLLSMRISVFGQRAKRKVIAHQKFYFFDAGVYRALRPIGPLDSIQEAEGAALETVFLQSLAAINDYFSLDYKIHFWRTTAGDEVDFIIYGPRGFHAFEIKRSSQINSKSLKGLKSFEQDYPEAKLYILFMGKQKEYHGNIEAIPFEQALRELPQLIS
ncbi:MAG TPA: AAA family ATPase [Candidatus Babeliaceae bacterium]|nr:AAA family ATPase [Candidatus Babeliaceae bacterium]